MISDFPYSLPGVSTISSLAPRPQNHFCTHEQRNREIGHMTPAADKHATGFSLVELSVASALLAMGLAGFSLLMGLALKGTSEAGHQSLAAAQASTMTELYLLSGRTAPPATVYGAWAEDVSRWLPSGRGILCLDSTPEDGSFDNPACDELGKPVVKLFWLVPSVGDDNGARRLVARLPAP
jgi:prepilin-type N-terminal cleavage/methylation domain-containing protein